MSKMVRVWGVGGCRCRQNTTSLMLSEAETLSITHAQGISVETLAPYLALSLAPRNDMHESSVCVCVEHKALTLSA